ncbi:SGNH/GDSL hydrolase family protein [Dyella sp. C9]|uniref:SGNH/GDSL hydrolase family protein n=1 Tax=Dyella sp. C9 TaxID=2202154 RepID=UPI0018E4FBCF|nr:SGNH/GDSL hydrolase family protein [Dyella sp. C9]
MQPPLPGALDHVDAQSLRLIVHASAAGSQVRIRLSNLYGDTPLSIGAARIALPTDGADIDRESDHALAFAGKHSVVIPPHATVVSDPVAMQVPALADLAISLYLPEATPVTSLHILAQQTGYVSRPGDATAAAHYPTARKIDAWPFLTGVDVLAVPAAFAVLAFGDSTVDGDGSTADANHRWPDALAKRLQASGRNVAVLNAGLIGNRLLYGSPGVPPFGKALGEAGVDRFSRDVIGQPGVKVVILRIGGNDIGFSHGVAKPAESVNAAALIAGYRRLTALAHQHGLRVLGTTIPPFEGTTLPGYWTPAKEVTRRQVNDWLRQSRDFDGMVDFDTIVRDPAHPSRLLPAFDSGDHLHPNDAGYRAEAAAIPLEIIAPPAIAKDHASAHPGIGIEQSP